MRALWVAFLPAIAYQALAIAAALGHLRKRTYLNFRPAVSVLKPVRGLDPNTTEAFLSQAQQKYPEFEILFGVGSEEDAAVPEIRRLQLQFPNVSIRLLVCSTVALNAKVGSLIDLARQARYPIWVVNDGDIKVTSNYLAAVVAPLADSSVGVVTCLYRASAHSAATSWEALGIATDFMPSTMVAQLLGVREFGLGSTLAFRASDLEAAGGFEAIRDYLADDFQLAKRISRLGKRALLSSYVVETSLSERSWAGVWNHQLRWARTIRRAKGAGYAGLPITHAGIWVLAALCCGYWMPALILLACRVASALVTGWFVLGSRLAGRFAWLAPLWDLYAFVVWAASYCGDRVRWRDRVLKIDRDGKIGR